MVDKNYVKVYRNIFMKDYSVLLNQLGFQRFDQMLLSSSETSKGKLPSSKVDSRERSIISLSTEQKCPCNILYIHTQCTVYNTLYDAQRFSVSNNVRLILVYSYCFWLPSWLSYLEIELSDKVGFLEGQILFVISLVPRPSFPLPSKAWGRGYFVICSQSSSC